MVAWDKKKVLVVLTLIIMLITIIAIFIVIGGQEEGVVVEFDSNKSWYGTIQDESGIRTVSGQVERHIV